jgi:hypothetical protein
MHLYSLAVSTAFFSSWAKDNPIDRQLLEELIRTQSDRLRPYEPQSITERKLDQYCRIAAVGLPADGNLALELRRGIGTRSATGENRDL